MGVLTRLGGVFKKKQSEAARAPGAGPSVGARTPSTAEPKPHAGVRLGTVTPHQSVRASPPRPSAPVEVEAPGGDDVIVEPKAGETRTEMRGSEGASSLAAASGPAPKNKQELLNELQKNYAEVVSLVRKVDQHLDAQDRRSARLMEIAEQIPAALQTLPTIRDETVRLGERLDALIQAQASQSGDAQELRRAQVEALGDVRTLLEHSREAEQRVAQSLDEFRGTMGQMSDATGTLGSVLTKMRESDTKRDERLASLVAGSSRAMMTVAIMVGLVLVVAVVIALLL